MPLIPEQTLAEIATPISVSVQPTRGLPILIIAYGLFGFGYIITATFLVTTVRLTPELRALEAFIWVLFGAAATPSVALCWVGQRMGLTRAFALACLTEALGVAASVEWAAVPGVCLSAVLLGGTFMGITALGLMAARQLSGGDPQRALGLMTSSFASGQMIGPTLAGLLFDSLGSLRVASLVAAAGLVLAAWLAVATKGTATTGKMPQRRDQP